MLHVLCAVGEDQQRQRGLGGELLAARVPRAGGPPSGARPVRRCGERAHLGAGAVDARRARGEGAVVREGHQGAQRAAAPGPVPARVRRIGHHRGAGGSHPGAAPRRLAGPVMLDDAVARAPVRRDVDHTLPAPVAERAQLAGVRRSWSPPAVHLQRHRVRRLRGVSEAHQRALALTAEQLRAVGAVGIVAGVVAPEDRRGRHPARGAGERLPQMRGEERIIEDRGHGRLLERCGGGVVRRAAGAEGPEKDARLCTP